MIKLKYENWEIPNYLRGSLSCLGSRVSRNEMRQKYDVNYMVMQSNMTRMERVIINGMVESCMAIYCNIPNFQFGMLYIDHSCISYFIAFHFVILEILSNSRILGESWGFPSFHIWVLSNIETRILVLIIFSLRKYFILKYMRGDNMTSPK